MRRHLARRAQDLDLKILRLDTHTSPVWGGIRRQR
jgi:hypothetical protein